MLKQKYQINLEQENFTANRFTVYIEKATDHYRDYLPLLLSLILIIVAWWGYNGTNTRLLGPPLGVMNGQDFRQVLRASAEITTGKNPYTHALLFGQTPNFKQFMDWNAAPYPYPPIVAVFARPLLWLETHQALKLWTGINFSFLQAEQF